jgi:3-hydroxyacyl-[acyl-carrier-protein] dehydratase
MQTLDAKPMTDLKPAETLVSLPPEDINRIIGILPHRYPFLLVDRVVEHIPMVRIRGYKNVTINEPFFQGHFPGDPIMPGVPQLEALAQLGALMMLQSEHGKGKLMVFAGIDNVRFRRIVVPGDRLDLECELLKLRPPIGKAACKGLVDGEVVVEAELMFSFVDRSAVIGKK